MNSLPVPQPSAPLTRRRFLGLGAGAAAGLALSRPAAAAAPSSPPLFPQLARVGDRFTIALLADSHFGPLEAARQDNAEKFRRIAAEINARQPPPAFVTHLGDVVGSPGEGQLAAARALLPLLQPLTVLVHGNHDGQEPWTEFKQLQRFANGTDATLFSFNCGRWHFVVLPFGRQPETEFSAKLIAWLEADLRAHRERPTMIFEHHHLLPQGLTQLETYTYEKPLRNRILDTLAAAGNVRWVFCGHVHNGIQAAVKTAWTWRGINFLTAPTVVPPRNFGEEYPAFAAGQPNERDDGGGYYLLVDVEGDRARVRGRLGGVREEYVFADTFRPYENQEPLWFQNIADLPARPALENGSFEMSLAGWTAPYRYIADRDPGYTWTADTKRAKAGRSAARLSVREKGQPWAKDEMTELYQWLQVPAGANPALRASCLIDEADVRGGGYLRFTAFAKNQPRLTYLFDWGSGDRGANMRMALHAQFMANGQRAMATDLINLGRRREALFWRLAVTPDRWHEVQVQLAPAYDQAMGQPGAFARLGVDRLLVGVGVWCGEARGSRSAGWFDDVALATPGGSEEPAVTFAGQALPVDARVFTTDFGSKHLVNPETGRKTKAGRKGKKK